MRPSAQLREVVERGSTSIVENGAVPGVIWSEVFVWPRDEDRLTLAFMTGA
jgi:hypothetical protein